MNGAKKIVSSIKRISNSMQPVGSKVVSLTVNSVNPLTFMLENRLLITDKFYTLSNLEDWSKLVVGDICRAFTFNEGQLYYILEKYPLNPNNNVGTINNNISTINDNISQINKNIDDINKSIETSNNIEKQVLTLNNRDNTLTAEFCFLKQGNLKSVSLLINIPKISINYSGLFFQNNFVPSDFRPVYIPNVKNAYKTKQSVIVGLGEIAAGDNFGIMRINDDYLSMNIDVVKIAKYHQNNPDYHLTSYLMYF